jgi:hypothetical protein
VRKGSKKAGRTAAFECRCAPRQHAAHALQVANRVGRAYTRLRQQRSCSRGGITALGSLTAARTQEADDASAAGSRAVCERTCVCATTACVRHERRTRATRQPAWHRLLGGHPLDGIACTHHTHHQRLARCRLLTHCQQPRRGALHVRQTRRQPRVPGLGRRAHSSHWMSRRKAYAARAR